VSGVVFRRFRARWAAVERRLLHGPAGPAAPPDLSFDLVKDLLLARFGGRGLTLVHQDPINRRSFGNTYAEFAAATFRLRLVQDRGQLLLSLAPVNESGNDWYPVRYVLEYLGKCPDVPPNELIDPRVAVAALDGAWTEVTAFLGGFPEGRQPFDRYLHAQFEARMRGITPTNVARD
jgi:hypothetical protein